MDNDYYKAPKSLFERLILWIIILIIGLIIGFNDSCRDNLHRLYNFIPPQKAKLTLVLKNGSGNLLTNKLLVFDDNDSLNTDNYGEVVLDLSLGQHSYTVLYGDSLHSYTLNLKDDSVVTTNVYLRDSDEIKDKSQYVGGSNGARIKLENKMYLTQWLTVGRSVQFGDICVKLLKVDAATNTAFVNVCRTVTNFECQTSILTNSQVSKNQWVQFNNGYYAYTLILEKIDNPPQDTTQVAAFMSLRQTIR